MMGPTHKVWAALLGAGSAHLIGSPTPVVALSAVVATATSVGWTSPDIDQTSPWRAIATRMPTPIRRAMGHRNLTHWPGLPAFVWAAAPTLPAEVQWATTALLLGWVSHLIGDILIGTDGIPLAPWGGWRIRLPVRTGGPVETVVRVVSGVAVVAVIGASAL